MRVLLKPKWIAGHLLALTVVVLFVNLGMWQLRRHDWRAERNERIEQGLAQDPVPLDTLPPGERDYRPVTVTGQYQGADVLLTPRNERGPGHHVLTGLRTEGGAVLLVDRGWVPFRFVAPPVPGAEAPFGEVRLEGVLLPAAEAEMQATRADGGRLLRVRAVRPDELLPELAGVGGAGGDPVNDVFLLLREQRPAPGELPVPGPLPQPDAGPHLSYAIQWFLFTAVVLAGYPLLLRRTVREARGAADRQAHAEPPA